MSALAAQGLTTMARIDLRTSWKALLAWTGGVVAVMAMTASSITALYDTPDKLQGYAASITGDALYMLNGRVAGVGTLGGVIANEFAFVMGFGVPIMAIAITTRATRRDEEAGRMELLLAARIGRHAPIVAAVLVATATLLVTAVGCALTMIAVDVDAGRSLLYGAGILVLGLVFVGITAVAAQVVQHNRSVWGIGLAVTIISILVRGVGAVEDNAVLWLSPHGWVDEIRPFGDARAWPLGLALLVAAVLTGLAFVLNTRRDVGSALVRPSASHAEASAFLRTPVGLAWHAHRGAVIGWAIGGAVLMATYGSLSQEMLKAIEDNPALAPLLGADASAADKLLTTVMSTFVMMLAMVVAAFAVMAVGALRSEEDTGRLETELSGDSSRTAWLATHMAVITASTLVVGLVGALALGVSTATSTGDGSWTAQILRGSATYLPVVAVFAALSIALFGLAPRWRALVWAVFAAAAVMAYLGPGFDLPDWLVRATLFQSVGANVLGEGADMTGVVVLTVLALALAGAGMIGFRTRDVPRG